MLPIRFEKVIALPSSLAANSMYMLKSGNVYTTYMTTKSGGTIVANKIGTSSWLGLDDKPDLNLKSDKLIPITTDTIITPASRGTVIKLTGAITISGTAKDADGTTGWRMGDSFVLYNTSTSALTVTVTGISVKLDGNGANKSSFSIPAYTTAGVLFTDNSGIVVTGKGIS
jgi:hypothetical protein